MNSNVIADERARPFFVKIKRSPSGRNFISEARASEEYFVRPETLPEILSNQEIKTTEIRFYGKHLWYHAEFEGQLVGWVKKAAIKTNYRRLDVPLMAGDNDVAGALSMLLAYFDKPFDYDELVTQFKDLDTTAAQAKIGDTIRYSGAVSRDISGATLKTLKRQIDRGRPVIVMIADSSQSLYASPRFVVVTGYSRRNIFYNDAVLNRKLKTTNQTLKKGWQGSQFYAISC
ncbi:C39 family peptidase [Secundilactobacillus kimchicus]|uniref:C39 family peptidase n=1 Tax=Secundilactobacillus kimchicus TaxID=528209 RepID=UPI000704F8CB|nr:C39 family peptidase [Secundilactobacillus kimchicus]